MKSKRLHEGRGGLGFSTTLFLIFLVLKLIGTIGWSWWLITLPLWGGVVLVFILAFILAMMKSP